jgi:pimeloyl-ACP methyl ester carboxylesterase
MSQKSLFKTGYGQFRLGSDILLAGCEYLGQFMYGPLTLAVARRPETPRAVITIPGFTGSDQSVSPLNDALDGLGYITETWGLGLNRGIPTRQHFDQQAGLIAKRAFGLADRTGGRVALVGHSLGGMYAREIARRYPSLIDRVITMGSPAHIAPVATAEDAGPKPPRRGRPLGRRDRDHIFSDEPPPGMPLVALFSRLDAIAPVRTTQIPGSYLADPDGLPRENIEVLCSHMGMAVNPLIQLVLADRLAEPVSGWRPFDAASYFPFPLRLAHSVFYPPIESQPTS